MAASNLTSTSRNTVVGYFADSEDAHRAINDLIAGGFRPNEIGAAFNAGSTSTASGSEETGEELRPIVGPNAPGAGTTTSGAGSDSSAVTPAGLSTGGGTMTSGASRPGPIPGGEIPSTLPHTIHSTLPSSLHPNPDAPLTGAQTLANYPATGGLHEVQKSSEPGWWEKLKNSFSGSDAASTTNSSVTDKTSRNFGTGEGHIGAYSNGDYAYSSAAFESAFFGMGIPSAHARYLSSRIRRGGAIVTVDAGTLNTEAEQIMERNSGSIRYEERSGTPSALASAEAWEEAHGEGRVRLLGRVQHAYPGYVSSSGSATRKAS